MKPPFLGENRNNLLRSITRVDIIVDMECNRQLRGTLLLKGMFRSSVIHPLKLTVSTALILILLIDSLLWGKNQNNLLRSIMSVDMTATHKSW